MRFDIIELEEFSGNEAKIYSIMLEDKEQTLFDDFVDETIGKYGEELKEIAQKLKVMGSNTGCKANLFKLHEGAAGDGVAAIYYKQLRLYCLRYDNTCIFIGSGGYKPPGIAAYQEDPILNSKAQQMRKIAAVINNAIKERDLIINDDGTIEMTNFITLEL